MRLCGADSAEILPERIPAEIDAIGASQIPVLASRRAAAVPAPVALSLPDTTGHAGD